MYKHMNYTYEQKSIDKKVYGCLDGDNARRCSICGDRFTGSISLKCPYCNKGDTMGVITMTDEDRFWELVKVANWPKDGYEKPKMKYLKMLSKEEAKEFCSMKAKFYKQLSNVARDVDGMGDDGFNDLINHIIGLGKKAYYEALNNVKLVQKRANDDDYKESFAYCFPYEDDYGKDNQYTYNNVVKVAKSAIKEIEYMINMDKDKIWLKDISDELCILNDLLKYFLINPDKKGLSYLITQKEKVAKYCKKIDKFFKDNYLELPRKFTEPRKNGSNFNGMCTSVIENTIEYAEQVLEFEKA